jgi:hypothetical protein
MIKEQLKRKLVVDNYNDFFDNLKQTQEYYQKTQKFSHLNKIVQRLIPIEEKKLKMVYQVISIITNINKQPDLTSLLSSDMDFHQSISDKISSMMDEANSSKNDNNFLKRKKNQSISSFNDEKKSNLF